MSAQMLSIAQAAAYLGVSKDTLRRWEKQGKVTAKRTSGGIRLFHKADLDAIRFPSVLSVSAAAEYLQISASTVRRLADSGILPFTKDAKGRRVFLRENLSNQTHSIAKNRPVKQGFSSKFLTTGLFTILAVMLFVFFIVLLPLKSNPESTVHQQISPQQAMVLGDETGNQNIIQSVITSVRRFFQSTSYWFTVQTEEESINAPREASAAPVPGPIGSTGATGSRGLAGATGASGTAGKKGTDGEKGDRGETGSGGLGATGATGIVGATGAGGTSGDSLFSTNQNLLFPGISSDRSLALGNTSNDPSTTSTSSARVYLDGSTGYASISGTLTVGNGQTIRSAYGPLQLQYKSGPNAWTTGFYMQDSTGNIGIGTTNPVYAFNIYNSAGSPTLNIQGMGGANVSSGLRLSESTNNNAWVINQDNRAIYGANETNNLTFWMHNNGNWVQQMLFAESGRIRIGNYWTSGNSYTEVISNRSDKPALSVVQAGTNDIFTASSSGTPRFTITNAGNVGIGTTLPNNTLDVTNTNAGAVTYPLQLTNSSATVNTGVGIEFVADPNNSQMAAIYAQRSGSNGGTDLHFRTYLDGVGTNATSLFLSGASRNIGINTTSPASRLDVQGGFGGNSAVRINQTNSGDIFTASSSGTPRFTITNAGNVGIGTAAPAYQLDIVGNGRISDGLVVGGNLIPSTNYVRSYYGFQNFGGTGSVVSALYYTYGTTQANTAQVLWSTTGDATSGSYDIGLSRISAGVLAVGNGTQGNFTGTLLAGNIGINTTSPASRLDIQGGFGGNAAVRINQTNSGDIFTASSSGTPKFTITNTGNVAINTVNPAGNLHIVNAVGSANSSAYIDGDLTQTEAGSSLVLRGRYLSTTTILTISNGGSNPIITNTGNNYPVIRNNHGGLEIQDLDNGFIIPFLVSRHSGVAYFNYVNVGIGTTSPTALLDIAGNASTSGTLAFRGTTDPKIDILNGETLGIRTSVGGDSGLSERLTILNNGNVGIGTTNPSHELDVNGVGRFSTAIDTGYIRGGGQNIVQVTTLGFNAIATKVFNGFVFTGTGNPGYEIPIIARAYNGQSNNIIQWQNSSSIGLGGIDATGNLGLGTTSPASRLDIQGGYAGNSAVTVNQTNSGDIFTASSSSTPRFTITNAGNVGIGTTQPNASLAIERSSSGSYFRAQGNGPLSSLIHESFVDSGVHGFRFYSNTEELWRFGKTIPGTNAFSFQDNSVNAVVFEDNITNESSLFIRGSSGSWNNGYVGIGTSVPSAKLDIAGNASTSGTLAFRGTTDPKIDILNGETLGIRTSVGGDSGLSERLTILNNGNVGIGTTLPSSTLHTRLTSTSTTAETGVFFNNTFNPTADTGNAKTGVEVTSALTGSNYINNFRGLLSQVTVSGTNTNNTVNASIGRITTTGTGSLNNGSSLYSILEHNSTGTWTNAYGLQIGPLSNNGTITNTYGVYVGDITTGTQTNTPFSFYASDANAYSHFAGNVGIGTTVPSTPLHVVASGTGNIATFVSDNNTGCTLSDGGIIACSSDARLKKNIVNVNNSLFHIMKLNPVSFRWHSQNENAPAQIGFLAQEVEAVFPDLVSTAATGFKSLNTTGLVPYLVKAVQEQQQQITSLTKESNQSASASAVLGTIQTDIVQNKINAVEAEISALQTILTLLQKVIAFTENSLRFTVAATFTQPVTFLKEIIFTTMPVYKDPNAAGSAVIPKGARIVDISFTTELATVPLIHVTPQNTNTVFTIENTTTKGFRIALSNTASQENRFTWFVTLAPDAPTFIGRGEDEPVPPTAAPTQYISPLPSQTPTPLPSPESEVNEDEESVASQSAVTQQLP